jgi:hypothetical protein
MDVSQTSGILVLLLFEKESKIVNAIQPVNGAAIRDNVGPVVATAVGFRGTVGGNVCVSGVTFHPRDAKRMMAFHLKQLVENRPKVTIFGQ